MKIRGNLLQLNWTLYEIVCIFHCNLHFGFHAEPCSLCVVTTAFLPLCVEASFHFIAECKLLEELLKELFDSLKKGF